MRRLSGTWPHWIHRCVASWAVLAGLVGGYWSLGGGVGAPVSGGAGAPPWLGPAVLVAAVVTAAAAVLSSHPHAPRRPILSGLIIGIVTAATGSWGLVLHLVVLLGTGTVDDPAGMAVAGFSAVGAVTGCAGFLSFSRRSRGRCGRCGSRHGGTTGPLRRPTPHPPRRRVRLFGYLGAAGFAPYILVKVGWALGLTIFGTAGPELERGGGLMAALAGVGVDLTGLLAALAALLSIALVRPWGQRFPRWVPVLAERSVWRWFPLSFAWLAATTLGPYGLITIGLLPLWLTGTLPYPQGPDAGPLWVAAAGGIGFAGFGLGVAIAALDYQRRTRPACEISSA